MMRRNLLLIPALLFLAPAFADYPLEIIRLNSRQVNEMIPVLRPFIDPDGSIAGMDSRLIIRTSPGNLQEIKRLLGELDRAAKRLMIHVRQARDAQDEESRIGADVNAMLGRDSKVVIGNALSGEGIRFRAKQARTRDRHDITQRIRATEGYPAFIASGQSIPVREQNTYLSNETIHRQSSVRYRNATTGFYVVPRINGDSLTLEISPHMVAPGSDHHSFDVQSAATVIQGRLGEWITVGGIEQGQALDRHGITRNISTRSNDSRLIELLVEEID
jgi:type II secretory pathway component GspD/PulD (secretin)